MCARVVGSSCEEAKRWDELKVVQSRLASEIRGSVVGEMPLRDRVRGSLATMAGKSVNVMCEEGKL